MLLGVLSNELRVSLEVAKLSHMREANSKRMEMYPHTSLKFGCLVDRTVSLRVIANTALLVPDLPTLEMHRQFLLVPCQH